MNVWGDERRGDECRTINSTVQGKCTKHSAGQGNALCCCCWYSPNYLPRTLQWRVSWLGRVRHFNYFPGLTNLMPQMILRPLWHLIKEERTHITSGASCAANQSQQAHPGGEKMSGGLTRAWFIVWKTAPRTLAVCQTRLSEFSHMYLIFVGPIGCRPYNRFLFLLLLQC